MLTWFLTTVAIYLIIGVLFGIYFVAAGVQRIDKAARGASLGFRVIIVPGTVALWPLLVGKLLQGSSSPRIERNAHRDAARKAQA